MPLTAQTMVMYTDNSITIDQLLVSKGFQAYTGARQKGQARKFCSQFVS